MTSGSEHIVYCKQQIMNIFPTIRPIIDVSLDAALVFDIDGNVIYMNRPADEIFGPNTRADDGSRLNVSYFFTFTQSEITWYDVVTNVINKNNFDESDVAEAKKYDVNVFGADGKSSPAILTLASFGSGSCGAVLHEDSGENVEGKVLFIVYIHKHSEFQQKHYNLTNKEVLTTALFDASFDPGFLITSNGTIKMANKAASDTFGHSKTEFEGQNISIICNTDDATRHSQYMERYMKTGVAHVIGKKRTLMAKKRNGTVFPIELGVKETKLDDTGETYFAGFVRDLTNEKLATEKLNALIESSFDAMFIISEKGIIEHVNSAATRVFGYKKKEFLNENISIICNDEDAKKHDKYMSRYLTTGEKRVIGKERELLARKKNGTTFPIQLGVSEVVMDDGYRVFCGFVKDLSKRKLNQERIQRNAQLTNGLINSAFDPMFLIDQRGIIQITNQAAVDHFGYCTYILGTTDADNGQCIILVRCLLF
jgi:PAS domain S-box-containing protein